jgi:hypothetical protein
MKLQKMVFVLILIVAFLIIAGCAAAATEPTQSLPPTAHPGEALLQSRCGTCHGVDRVNTATYNRETWGPTIDQMVALGATVSDEQKEMIIDYLVSSN